MNPLKLLIHSLGRQYIQRTLPPTTGGPRGVNERPIEYEFALRMLRAQSIVTVLDVGSGAGCWPALLADCGYSVAAIDEAGSYWNGRYFNRHCRVEQHDISAEPMRTRFDAITCLSVLEHIPQPLRAIRNMAASFDGMLILTFPFNEDEYVANAYALPDAGYGTGEPYVTQIYNRAALNDWLAATGLKIVTQEYAKCFTGPLWTVGERLRPMLTTANPREAHLTCVALTHQPESSSSAS